MLKTQNALARELQIFRSTHNVMLYDMAKSLNIPAVRLSQPKMLNHDELNIIKDYCLSFGFNFSDDIFVLQDKTIEVVMTESMADLLADSVSDIRNHISPLTTVVNKG